MGWGRFDCIYSSICFAYCILLIQIPWHSDKSIVLFLGPDNKPNLLDGLVCPCWGKKKKVCHVIFVTLLQSNLLMLDCFLLFYLACFLLPWQTCLRRHVHHDFNHVIIGLNVC